MGKKKNKRKRAEADEAAGSGGDDDEGVGELIGFVHDGELFLRDATTGIIFDAERDPAGRRVRVGTWDTACQQPRFDPKPVAPVAAPAKAPAPPPSIPHPPPDELTFIADEEDHCETAPQAYEDIAQLLHLVAASLGKASSELRIYDPYFCNGAVARHLNALGFPHVYNRNEDFYAVQDAGSVPAHDVVVTNPPYSGTHPQRLLSFLTRNAKPWLVLMPNWVYAKEYYEPSLSDGTGGRHRRHIGRHLAPLVPCALQAVLLLDPSRAAERRCLRRRQEQDPWTHQRSPGGAHVALCLLLVRWRRLGSAAQGAPRHTRRQGERALPGVLGHRRPAALRLGGWRLATLGRPWGERRRQ